MMEITISICTYQRPRLLQRLIESLRHQETREQFSYSIVVTDNDPKESAREVVSEIGSEFPVPILYCTEPRRSISHARNTGLSHAKGDYIAIIDDDEFADSTWLMTMRNALLKYEASGVLGPVRPHFDYKPPAWVLRGHFCERPEHPTGYRMKWGECRTGNVLFRRDIIAGMDPVFTPAFGTGGSDVDFFRRMIGLGHNFIWCNEAPVHEVVPPSRATRTYMLRRGLLRGGNAARHPVGKWTGFFKSLIALVIYTIFLPFLLIRGQHYFMRYMISWCDHFGRIAGTLGVSIIKSRPM